MRSDSVLLRSFSLVLASVVLAACGSTVEGGDDGAETGVGGSGTGGSGTGGSGTTSSGGELCGGQPLPALFECPGTPICTNGQWGCELGSSASTSTSTGQVETCPDWAPPPGTACTTEGLTCVVDSGVDCGPVTVEIVCADGVWVQLTPRCQPMPCSFIENLDECEANGCRWAEPGCGGTPIAAAGCFEAGDCTVDGCIFGECTVVSVEPACASQNPPCNSCGEDVALCIETPVGQGGGAP